MPHQDDRIVPSRSRGRRRWSRALAILAAAAVWVAVLPGANPAAAATRICDQYGRTTIKGGRFVVQNNRWGAGTAQCIDVTDTGFRVVRADHDEPTDGAPASYPSIYRGCHYATCSTGSGMPARVSGIRGVPTSVAFTYPSSGTWNAAYDIWLDPAPRTDGQHGAEIMIWFNRRGPVQPIGSRVGTTTIGGRTWEVWRGNPGWEVVSYVAPSPVRSWRFDAKAFIDDAIARGALTRSWYLTSVQAGFEPWVGGTGLAVESFTAGVK